MEASFTNGTGPDMAAGGPGDIYAGKTILITGGTGSLGNALVERFLKTDVRRIIIYSRDEFKQYHMEQKFAAHRARLRFFIGDVRDRARLYRAFTGVDYVIHAAALKHVHLMEYNPHEAVQTNIVGAMNLLDAAIDRGVKKVVALSTDKAVNPVNLYGATKLVSDKLFRAAHAYSAGGTQFVVVRYGNVVGSRGSVIPFFRRLTAEGADSLPITDSRMTRFWITLDQSVDLVVRALETGGGGEVFLSRIPSCLITDVARAVNPQGQAGRDGHPPGREAARGDADRGRGALDLRLRRSLRGLSRWPTPRSMQEHVRPGGVLVPARVPLRVRHERPVAVAGRPHRARWARWPRRKPLAMRGPRMKRFLPYGRQDVGAEESRRVRDVLESDWLTQGPHGPEFEAALAASCGAAHAVAVANGTLALYLACRAAGLGPGDRFIVPPITFVATANAGVLCGAEPVFVDIDPRHADARRRKVEAALMTVPRIKASCRCTWAVAWPTCPRSSAWRTGTARWSSRTPATPSARAGRTTAAPGIAWATAATA